MVHIERVITSIQLLSLKNKEMLTCWHDETGIYAACPCTLSSALQQLTCKETCIYAACPSTLSLKVHKIENFFDPDFEICVISLLVMHK